MFHWLRVSYGYDIREVPEMLKLKDQQIIKFSVYHQNACEEMCAPLFTPAWKDKTVMAAAGKEWMDCTPIGSGKGPALAFLQKYLGISPEETCTFGDNLNDIEMLQNAGFSYAVSQLPPGSTGRCQRYLPALLGKWSSAGFENVFINNKLPGLFSGSLLF